MRKHEDQLQIWDEFRKQHLLLTPEEWVRQHFAHYLVKAHAIPPQLMKLEYQIKYNQRKKRPDIGVIDSSGNPWLLVECKAPSVKLTEDTFFQLSSYFSVERPRFIALTNGIQHIYAEFQPDKKKFVFIQTLPVYAA